MLFVEFVFLPFFLTVFSVYWLLRTNRSRKIWLLFWSFVFYGSWDWRFLSLLIASTLIDYTVGIRLERPGARRKLWLWVSLTGNLGILGFFKYFDFFVDSAADFVELLGFEGHRSTLQIILPVGISFYTFQTLSYGIDVYRRRLKATRSLLDFSLFVAFFPQLVAGPIVRASDFLPQLDEKKHWARVDKRKALVLFLIGFFKKAVVSDTLAPFVDAYFNAPERYDGASSWIAIVCYAVQVYCDFSGYTDMAIACAWLLGYELCVNFDYPYLSKSVDEVWSRWHISLSSWLRDYVYVPLGGSRGGRWVAYKSSMLTMLIAGLWHGAAWTFIVWGGLYGLGLWAVRARNDFLPGLRLPDRFPLRTLLCVLVTFWFWCLCLVPFRAQSVPDMLVAMQSFLTLQSPGTLTLGTRVLVVLAVLAAVHLYGYLQGERVVRAWRALPDWAFYSGLGVCAAAASWLIPAGVRPFVYFQF